MRRLIATLALALWLPAAPAAIDAFPFDDPAAEARYQQLIDELRCLVCQNQALSDSNAELAMDLRRQVYDMVQEGRSNEAVVDYMVQRYGDFVLYRPPMRPETWVLWFGPVLLLGGGSLALWLFVRRRSTPGGSEPETLDAAESRKLDELLGADREKSS